MKNYLGLGVLFLSFLSACGVKNDGVGDTSGADSNGQYSYLFRQTVNGEPCSTGRKTATNHDEYCTMLADDSENRDEKTDEVCARTLRAARVQSECPGVAMVPPDDDSNGL